MKSTLDIEDSSRKLKQLFRERDIIDRAEICAALGFSQPTFSRLFRRLEHEILTLGGGRGTRYAMKREIAGAGTEFPLYRIDETGRCAHEANLVACQSKGFVLFNKNAPSPVLPFEGMPFFMEDLRPAGFLGRLVPSLHPDLDAPADIRHWSDDHVLRYLTRHGWDLPGDLIVGEAAFRLYLKHRENPENEPAAPYPRLAEQVLLNGLPGSSAAGEQPKFLTARGDVPVLVKFSPPGDTPVARRWNDLLLCEHLAHDVMRQTGQTAAKSRLVRAKERLFLECERFDRVGRFGRKGVLSLGALALEYGDAARSWSENARRLAERRVIDENARRKILWLEVFGKLIANTDRHGGNVAFFTAGLKPIEVAPAYDMLPMLYRPTNDQLVERNFSPPLPEPAEAPVWRDAFAAAKEFWKRVAAAKGVSAGFAKIAKENLKKLESLDKFGDILPR